MNTAFVKIWGQVAGAIAWDETRGLATFEFSPAFIKNGWDIAPIMMPLGAQSAIHVFPALRKKTEQESDTFKGLPGLLADALPDRYGSELINLWLAGQGRPLNSMNPVEMLCFMGSRGMGALEFEPAAINENSKDIGLEIESLVEAAGRMLNDKDAFVSNLRTGEKQVLNEILRIGTSAGGARPKAVIAFNEKTGEVRSGQIHVPAGYEHWIIKMDGVSNVQLGETHGYGRVEMAYYLMAKDCEIEIMPSKLLVENGRAHFMTKRFDRAESGIKHHVQTFCALKHFDFNNIVSYSYEEIFQTMRELRLTYPEAEQMFRRMVFNVMARNCDDHTKNFSFRLKKDERWTLAPAYDLCHAYSPNHRWVSHHALSINGKRNEIKREDLLSVAKMTNIKKPTDIIDQIASVISQWHTYADMTEVNPDLKEAIGSTLITL